MAAAKTNTLFGACGTDWPRNNNRKKKKEKATVAATLNGTLSGNWVKASSHPESSSSSSICSDSPPPAAVVDGSCAWERRHQQDAGGFHPQEQRQAPHRVWYKQWGGGRDTLNVCCLRHTHFSAGKYSWISNSDFRKMFLVFIFDRKKMHLNVEIGPGKRDAYKNLQYFSNYDLIK